MCRNPDFPVLEIYSMSDILSLPLFMSQFKPQSLLAWFLTLPLLLLCPFSMDQPAWSLVMEVSHLTTWLRCLQWVPVLHWGITEVTGPPHHNQSVTSTTWFPSCSLSFTVLWTQCNEHPIWGLDMPVPLCGCLFPQRSLHTFLNADPLRKAFFNHTA